MILVEQMKLAGDISEDAPAPAKDITTAAKPSEAEKCSRQEEQPERLINDSATIHLLPIPPHRNFRLSS